MATGVSAQYRPPGRSNRSGRSNVDNDVFEGLPVKQWAHAYSRVSLAPPVSEVEVGKDDKWGEPPMPRDYHLLLPWTQHLLRLARSGKVGNKRKQDADLDDDKPDDDALEDDTKPGGADERGYVARKWKPIPEHSLEPEHKHFTFLAKRRRGLPSLYGPDQEAAVVPMRRTKVQKADVNGAIAIYEVLVPEGQTIDGEIAESTELAGVKPVTAAPGKCPPWTVRYHLQKCSCHRRDRDRRGGCGERGRSHGRRASEAFHFQSPEPSSA
jgi:hypothetical protein